MAININQYLTDIIEAFNGSLYCKDINGVYLGCNRCAANKAGLKNPSEIIGKTDYDLFGKAEADVYRKNDLVVIQEGKELAVEEIITLPNGEKRVHLSVKRPLYSKNEPKIIIGIIGNTIDITAEKEAQQFKLENEHQQIVLQEKEKFGALARKVAHDIKSPLAALTVMIGSCDEVPEEKRILLNRATESILDITNNLIANYQIDQPRNGIEAEPRQALLVSDLLVQLLSEKKVQYRDNAIRFESAIAENAQFAFIRTQKSEFRRAISNLINNAVDALKGRKDGKITVHLTATSHAVIVTIEDNGEGMSEESSRKMQKRLYFTEGKENGHGLGLQQVWDMLESNRGRLAVQSALGRGTTVTLTFPRSAAAKWITQEMRLTSNQTIVILDDEQSIHDAWNMHFAPLLISYPQLRLRHFTQGNKVLSFINGLARSKKDNVMLLSDYELLHQPRNGLEIIQASNIRHSILVTSHYANPTVRDAATKLKVKILPKQMASIIPIHVE
jgi:signal transduction histidine kinase